MLRLDGRTCQPSYNFFRSCWCWNRSVHIYIHWTNTDWWWFSHDVSKTCIKVGMDSFISFILHRECNIMYSFISFILYHFISFISFILYRNIINKKKTACMVCKSEDVQQDLSWLVPCWVKASKTWIRKKLVMATAICEQIKININKTIYTKIYIMIYVYILIYTTNISSDYGIWSYLISSILFHPSMIYLSLHN